MTLQTEDAQPFYGRSKEMELYETLLQSPKGALIFRGEHGIGKTELVRQLVLQARTHKEYRIACGYVEAWPSMLATDPFVDVLARVLDSIIELESTSERIRARLEKLARALVEEATALVGALLTDLAQKLVGKETIDTVRNVLRRCKARKSELDQARSTLVSKPRSFTYAVNTVLSAIHRSNPDLKILLVFDQFERISESAWWILLDLIRGSPEQVYVLAAFRHEAESIQRSLEKFLLEGSRIEGVRTKELQGLEPEEIGDWIQRERHVGPLSPQLSRIRRNSGGFPILLAPWIHRSASLDPEELKVADLRKSVCEEVTRRITEQPLDLAVVRFLHQLSVLQFPPPMEAGPKCYEELTGVESVVVGSYSELLAKRWILDGNRERPWFRHELIKLCIEDGLRENERVQLHEKGAAFYQRLFDEARKGGGLVPFSVFVGCGYHFHQSGDYKKSLSHNDSLASFAHAIGELDVADECYRRAIEDARALDDKGSLLRIKADWAGILATWGKLEEARAIYQEVLPFFEENNDEKSVAIVLANIGHIEKDKSNYCEAELLFKRSLQIYEKLGDQEGVSTSLLDLSLVATHRGNYFEAEDLCRRSLQTSTKLGDQRRIAANLHQLGMITRKFGRYSEAEDLYKRSLEIAEGEADTEGIAGGLGELGNLAWMSSRYDEAERLYKRCLDTMEILGKPKGISACLCQLAIIAEHRGNYSESEQLQKRSLEMAQRLGDQEGISESLQQLGILAQHQEKYEEAERLYRQSLETRERIGSQEGVAACLGQLGSLFESMARFEEAEKLVSRALEIFTRIGNKPMQEQASDHLNRIRAKLNA
ncbi:tetratricopeptide repeat protein [Candidatus Bathyarchaeota archaeon]|nr:tetratricopeptide repeat protein [Candidatus Bathyarchaeota archaeon]